MNGIYNESMESSESNNDESYDKMFNHNKKFGKNNQSKKMASTGGANMYNLNNVKSNAFADFGNSGFGNSNFGKTAQFGNMLGPFNNKGGLGNDIYNLNNIDLDLDKYKDENKKKENAEDKKSIRESTESKKGNKFIDQIGDEFGDSSLNKNSKIDYTEQSQRGSKISKENKQIKEEEKEEEEKEEEIEEEKEDEKKDFNALNEVKNEQNQENEEEKRRKMMEYMESHKPKINFEENKVVKNENEIKNSSNIEEQINSNINDTNHSKLENKSKIDSSKVNEDEYYNDFDNNIESIAINNQDNITSLMAKKNDLQKEKDNINTGKQAISESNTNKYLASSDYEGEFGESNIKEINKIEEKNNKSLGVDSLINQVNNEHKQKSENLESLESKITNKDIKKEENINPNIYSNNNLNNIINSNNYINSVASGDSVNVKNIIRNEVKKYDNDIPGLNKNEYNDKKFIPGSDSIVSNNNQYNNNLNKYSYNLNPYNNQFQGYTFKNDKKNEFNLNDLRRINIQNFAILKYSKKQIDLLKLKNDEALKQERRKRENVEFENRALREENSKLLKEIEILSNQKNQNFEELKLDYENSVKAIENVVINREIQKAQNLIKDMENKYQTDIIKKDNEINRLKNEYEFLENRYKNLDEEYKKIKDMNEKDERIYELENEKYRLYEQINEMKQKQNTKKALPINNNNNNNNNKSDTTKVYEQLLNEREINTQEKILNNYLKEIKKLNEEIIFLKGLVPGSKLSGPGPKQKENLSNIDMTLNNINYRKSNNNNYVINPSLQESAEKQIRKLQNFLLPSSPNDASENKMILMEKEFNRLQNKESPNEITFDNFLSVMKRLQVPLSSNELIEVFNNFPRIKGNRIRMNDFINALNSKVPSSYFMQSDPSYLNELESKLIKGQNRIKELEKFILVNNNENEEFKEQLKKSMNENKLLKNKINDLNSQILQYFLFREEKNLSNPDVIQMKEKMKNFELKNKTMNNELSEKFGKYEKKIEELKKTYEDERINLLKEKDGFKDQINKLKNEKEKAKNEFDKREIKYKSEIDQLNEKLIKYKKNYNILINKNENNKKEKERILNSFKDRGFDSEQIMTYINSSANIQEILNKIEDLERKNLNREEIYKKICMDVNQTQVNKELEKLKKKHEEEKRGLLKIITQKNNELNSIKSEFFGIMNELERLKASKFK